MFYLPTTLCVMMMTIPWHVGLVLIGKPGAGKRTQGRILDAAPGLTSKVVRILLVIHLRCDDDEALLARLRIQASAEGRHDDRESAMRKRLDVYARETLPVLDYYAQDRIADINGMQHPLIVHSQVLHPIFSIVAS